MPKNHSSASRTPHRAHVKTRQGAVAEAVAAARELAWSGQHDKAIESVSSAFTGRSQDLDRLVLLELRAESLTATGDVDRALKDAEEMLAIAERTGDAGMEARALNCLARVQWSSGGLAAAVETAERAVKTARRSRKLPLIPMCLLTLSAAQMRLRQSAAAIANATAAAQKFATLGDEVQRGRAMWVIAGAQDDLGRKTASERAAEEALAIARRTGDRWGEASALNIRWRQHIDLAMRLRGLHQSLAAYQAAGHVSGQAAIYNNLALAYRALGLYRRSNRMAQRTIEIRRRLHDFDSVSNALVILTGNEYLAGNVVGARARFVELEAMQSLPGVDVDGVWSLGMAWAAGLIANAEGDGAAALPFLQNALRLVEGMPDASFRILTLADLCRAHLLLGQTKEALATSERATDLYRARENRSMGAGLSPAHVWWWRHRALEAQGIHANARKALEAAYDLLLEGIRTLSDEGLRRSYLNKIDAHREIVRAWIEHARKRRLPAKRAAAHLAGRADLRAPFERLVDTGVRLNELRSAEELHEFLVDEVTELSGAERVLLVLESAGSLRVAGSLVPVGEDASVLLHSVTPWLEDARRARVATLRHLPEGANPLDQRSSLVVPLIAQQRLLGFLYADIDGVFGRFRDTDRDLMTMLAAQAAVALDNAQWAQELERKVDERTDELTRSLERQTATAEILEVISESPTDVQPVFRAIVHTAVRLLSCDSAGFMRCDGKTFSPVVGALRDGTPMRMEHSDTPVDPDANFPSRVIVTKTMLHVPDWSAVDLPEQQQGVYDRLGVGSSLMLPLLRADECIGVLALGRVKAGAFTDAEIALAKSFVDQAVIADRERAPFQRDSGSTGPADRDGRHPARDQQLADRRAAGIRRHRQDSAATLDLRFRRRDAVRWRYVLAGRGRAPAMARPSRWRNPESPWTPPRIFRRE